LHGEDRVQHSKTGPASVALYREPKTWQLPSSDSPYYFDSATLPNIFSVELAKVDFKEGAPVKKLMG